MNMKKVVAVICVMAAAVLSVLSAAWIWGFQKGITASHGSQIYSPETGDNTLIFIFVAVGVIAIALVIFIRRRR